MPEFECPFQSEMMDGSKEVREVVIRGKNVEVTASNAGGNLNRGCILKEINDAKLRFYPGQVTEHMHCNRCGRGIALPKEFVDNLLQEPHPLVECRLVV